MVTSLLRGRAGSVLLMALALAGSNLAIAAPPVGAPAGADKLSVDRIHKALSEYTELEFVETPLQDVADYLSDKHHAPIVIDAKALEAAGCANDTPITVNLKEIPLESALRIMLGKHDLAAFIHSDVLLITTIERANTTIDLRVYDAAELVGEEDASKLASVVQQAMAFASGATIAAPQSAQPNYARPVATQLTPLVYSVTPFRNTLVVRANDSGHAEINKLFAELQQKLKKPVAAAPTTR